MRRSLLGRLCAVAVPAVVALAGSAGVALAQNAIFRGTVRAENGEAIVGANVYIVELAVQAATNEAGRYLITVPGDRVRGQSFQLRVRAIGFRPSSRAVTITAGEQSLDFTLSSDINRLEEIVVTGVMEGTEAARVPFSVARVDVSDLPVPAVDPVRELAGRVPGMSVVSTSGRPGQAASVILRGPTSIDASGRGQGPMYMVDGAVITGNLPDINPSDIENIEVIRGAAASSLYGARAGSGVISITTRSGRRAADGMTYNTRVEYGKSDIEGEFLLARQHTLMTDETGTRFCISRANAPLCANTIDWNTEVLRVNNNPGDFALSPATFPIDPSATLVGLSLRNRYQAQLWPGLTYNAVNQMVQSQNQILTTADATGRFGQTQVYSSVSYLDAGGAIRFQKGYNRYSGRLNVDQNAGNNITVQLRSYYARTREDGLDNDGSLAGAGGPPGAFFRLTRVPAIANILARDTLGRVYVRSNLLSHGAQDENPIIRLLYRSDVGTTDRFIGGLTLRWAPQSWVDVEASGSYDLRNFTEDYFQDKGYRTTGTSAANAGSISQSHTRDWSYNVSLAATLRQRVTRDIAARWNFRTFSNRQDSRYRYSGGNTLGAQGVPDLDNATAGFAISSSMSSVREVGYLGGLNLDFLDGRYILEGLLRRDGTSLLGSANRWATFGRISAAWRASAEPWWFGGSVLSDMKLRFSRGSAGNRPSFTAQYQTFGVTTAGPTLQRGGNVNLRPETNIDNEFGADIELFHRVGLQVTRALSTTRDQILLVPLSAEKGFQSQWGNAGTLDNKTWEFALNVPLITRRLVSWSWRFTLDQTRTTITKLTVPPFTYGANGQGTLSMFFARQGERYGTFYGREYVRSCGQLPTAFQADCGGSNSSFQINDDGFVVWVGQGNTWRDGITRNLWETSLPGANAPWGVPMNWGMPIIIRDTVCITTPSTTCPAQLRPLGNALPDWQFSGSTNFQIGRFTVYALMQGVLGKKVFNEGFQWSHLNFITRDIDQAGRTPETAKPSGYYWRAGSADGQTGLGGLYDVLGSPSTSFYVESAAYAKLRELMVSYTIGPIGGVGNWTASLVGRNLFTITNYRGFDPEVGQAGGTASSSAVNAVDAFSYPNPRTLTFALSTSF